MIHTDIIQGTPEWFDIKRGKISASHMSDVLSKGKGVTRRNYLTKLVVERLTGKTEETFCSNDMQNGIDREEAARLCYEFEKGVTVDQVGFIDHADIENYGCSPDGLVGEDGMTEIKSPKAATHIEYLRGGVVPSTYIKQMQSQMDVADRKYNDFISYCPDMPTNLQLFVCRLERDDEMIGLIRLEAITLNKEVEATIAELKQIAVQT